MREEPECREMMLAFGRYVRETRHLLGWSQEQLAYQAHTSQGLISRLERGSCLQVPFLSIFKVLSAFAAVVDDIDGAVPPPFRLVLACAAELPRPREAPPDPDFARFLQAYQALPVDRKAMFVQMLQALVTILEKPIAVQESPV